jgi:hypothetical protein
MSYVSVIPIREVREYISYIVHTLYLYNQREATKQATVSLFNFNFL